MNIPNQINHLRKIIQASTALVGRQESDVQLLAVSKGHPSDKIRVVYQAGIKDFGENYLQEALEKQQELSDLNITWHFLGPIQRNKAKKIAQHFAWVHTLTRVEVAALLNQHRPSGFPPLNTCIQVNISGETTKSGVRPDEVIPLIKEIRSSHRLSCRGLMTIPPKNMNDEEKTALYRQLTTLMCQANQTLSMKMDTLSMGMSDDMVQAIQSGSTMVRIGTAIFGPRQ